RYHSYVCVICKYLMHKKAREIAKQEGAWGIITGDNLAQVASQTLKNLFAYRTTSEFPVYSPLISFEKEQTVQIAREIGTYDLSVIKTGGCTPPTNPKTGVSIKAFQKILTEIGM
ncbi:MAG: tRNA uracil 4-sulfurtransferase, partial [Acidobacteriota bacterium]|nr:tRNA uracil 4-sulfurtransferase [Acidobacteriota bacterium]